MIRFGLLVWMIYKSLMWINHFEKMTQARQFILGSSRYTPIIH